MKTGAHCVVCNLRWIEHVETVGTPKRSCPSAVLEEGPSCELIALKSVAHREILEVIFLWIETTDSFVRTYQIFCILVFQEFRKWRH